jgi:hypothetical protein
MGKRGLPAEQARTTGQVVRVVRLRGYAASARQPSHAGSSHPVRRRTERADLAEARRKASEGWLAALDDFRNWLIREAA